MTKRMTSIEEIRNQVRDRRRSRLDAMLTAIAICGLPTLQEIYRDPRAKQVKELGPMPSGQASEQERQITTGPKRGKGTRKQRKGKR